MNFTTDVENRDALAIMRLLSGPLAGCEYKLFDATTIVISGSATSFIEGSICPDFPLNSIVIPFSEVGENFEIVISKNIDDGFKLKVIENNQEISALYQTVCHVGELSFTLRLPNDEFSSDIAVITNDGSSVGVSPIYFWCKVFILIISFFVLLAVSLKIWLSIQEDKRVVEIKNVISGSNNPYHVIQTKDGEIYIFAESERDSSWAKQALMRGGKSNSFRISTVQAEEDRINKLLIDNYPLLAYHRIKLTDPKNPILVLSKERGEITPQLQQSLLANLYTWLPYAKTVELTSWSDLLLDQRAKDGLEKIGVSYTYSSNSSSTTYSIAGGLSDIDLLRLQDFSQDFYRNFGSRYVHFSIELKDDFLKEKSFQYGPNAYVKMDPKHWFFSKIF